MPQDIRSFFGKPKAKAQAKEPSAKKEPEKEKAKKKRVIEDSDSDSDFVSATPPAKKVKAKASKKELDVVDPKDFFAEGAASSASSKPPKEKKKENVTPPKKEKKEVKKEVKKEETRRESPRKSPRKSSRKEEEKTKLKLPKKEQEKKSKYAPAVESSSSSKKSAPKREHSPPPTKKSNPVPAKKSKPPPSPEKPNLMVEPSKFSQEQKKNAEPPTLLWVDKYKPANLKGIIGQQGDKSNMKKLVSWVQNWTKYHATVGVKAPARPPPWNSSGDNGSWAKAALLSGPPGVGKTTTAYLVAKELGYDVMEMNASDTRSKKLLEASLADAVSSQSLSKVSKRRILLMDEVDGMAGNEDRGGMAELILVLKASRIPVICMCNDRNASKIRSLANHCFDLRFSRPRAEQIRASMMSVCFKEKLKIAPDALNEIIVGCNQDVRQVLYNLSMLKSRTNGEDKLTLAEAKVESGSSKKTSIKVGPFDVVRKVFSKSEQAGMSIYDKSDLFFHDYSMGPLFNQENYLSVQPHAAKNKRQTMELVSKAADSFCEGDVVDATLRSKNAWGLLPTQAMFQSVIPGEYMSGHMQGQIAFPAFLGKLSKTNKTARVWSELTAHTRLRSGVSKSAMCRELAQPLRDAIVRPLKKDGAEGVASSVGVMKEYALLREDLDNLLEATQWPGSPMPLSGVDSKVKAAFTRMYNKEIVLPYATLGGAVNKKRGAAMAEPVLMNEDEEEEADDVDEDDISSDAMIKAKKTSKAKAAAEPKGKGKGTGKGSRGGKKK